MKIQLTQDNKPLTIFSYSSLTDIVLLLLVFFLLTSSFIITEGINVTLPEAENTTATEQEQLVIALLNDGRIFLNNIEVPAEGFRVALQEKLTDPEKQVIVLSSDADVSLQRAVFVMDEAKGLGATRFFISTTQKENDDTQQR
ncbi:MAG: biopolymer transporter ExbD [Bacteroidetes bacterium]|nr:biopolymer transporter ExbD [Bacteroidota bacterium]